jgi:hypothetical protein
MEADRGSPTNSPKKIRGAKKGGMIRLGRPSETMALSEGWENALAWRQFAQEPENVGLAAAVDLGNLGGVILPDGVKAVTIIADNDSELLALHTSIRTAMNRFLGQGIAVSVHWPPPGQDFNNVVLREKGKAR